MSSTVPGFDRQPKASTGNRSQREMPFFAVVAPKLLDAGIVSRATFSGVMADAARTSGLDDYQIAAELNVCAPYFSRLMRGVAQQWAKRIVNYCRITGSLGPVQWMAEQVGCDLVPRDSRAAEVAALKARLQELERAA